MLFKLYIDFLKTLIFANSWSNARLNQIEDLKALLGESGMFDFFFLPALDGEIVIFMKQKLDPLGIFENGENANDFLLQKLNIIVAFSTQ